MKIIVKSIFVATGLATLAVSGFAQGGVPLWTNRYTSGSEGTEIATDGAGNVFVTGRSSAFNYVVACDTVAYSSTGARLWTKRLKGPGQSSCDNAIIAVGTGGNVFVTAWFFPDVNGVSAYGTVAYSGAGVALWTNFYTRGLGFEAPWALAVDNNTGNVVVTGDSYNGTNLDYATVAYSGTGMPLWTNLYGEGTNTAVAWAIGIGVTGNVFVTGYATGASGNQDCATVAYSSAGMPLWTNRYHGEGGATAVATDGHGNVYVTGGATDSGGNGEMATVAYSGIGVPLWTNIYKGEGSTSPSTGGLVVDGYGNVVVTGHWTSGGGESYVARVAYSGAGAPLWTNLYLFSSGTGTDYPGPVATDRGGNVMVTGMSADTSGLRSYLTSAYASSGEPLWTNIYHPPNSDDYPNAIAVDPSGNVIVTGSGSGYLTIKYSSSLPTYYLDSQMLNNQLVLSWTNAGVNLQSSPVITGTFTNIPGATSPYTNSFTGPQQFFRLIGN